MRVARKVVGRYEQVGFNPYLPANNEGDAVALLTLARCAHYCWERPLVESILERASSLDMEFEERAELKYWAGGVALVVSDYEAAKDYYEEIFSYPESGPFIRAGALRLGLCYQYLKQPLDAAAVYLEAKDRFAHIEPAFAATADEHLRVVIEVNFLSMDEVTAHMNRRVERRELAALQGGN